jgi:PAS domain-containing protein
MTDSFEFSTSITTERMPDPGLFTWDLSSDLVYADSAVASLFGLDPSMTERGLPIRTYLERVHPDDRASLAKQISDAIIAEHPTEQFYRTLGLLGKYNAVRVFGRCFRDKTDNPVHYAGVVIPAPSTAQVTSN